MSFKKRYLRVLSRHPSHDCLRKPGWKREKQSDKARTPRGILLPVKAVIRFGSQKQSRTKIQINSAEAVQNSSNKVRMKTCFDKAGVRTPKWWTSYARLTENEVKFPLVGKRINGSRGQGMQLINNQEELEAYHARNRNAMYERFHNYTREYRLHVWAGGCFYTCRKMLKNDAPENKKWCRNDENCVWILEDNELFDKPATWQNIVNDCVKALKAVDLDVGACDVKVATDGRHQIIEINSAPSFGETTEEKYREIIPKIVESKCV